MIDREKMEKSLEEIRPAMAAQAAAVNEILPPEKIRPNVVGCGAGVKWVNGQPTGRPAVVVLVERKVPREELFEQDIIPAQIEGVDTDVLAVGPLFAGLAPPFEEMITRQVGRRAARPAVTEDRAPFVEISAPTPAEVSPPQLVEAQLLARRIRPAQGGWSVGSFRGPTGTIATCVYDLLPGSTVSPPRFGEGIPPRFYILSNNHVLANSNAAAIGDPILQPGPADGGINPVDRIARLSRFIPITFDPPVVDRTRHRNLVDAAIAEGRFDELDRSIYWSGYPQGWYEKRNLRVGMQVKKTGRTTNFTLGHITAINATVDVNYPGGRVARFLEQIVTTNMSAPGDSGSLVLDLNNKVVGLLFAGSNVSTIINPFENVRALLRVEVSP